MTTEQLPLIERVQTERRRCPQCRLIKSFDEFTRNRRTLDGCSVYCTSCWAERRKHLPSSRRSYWATWEATRRLVAAHRAEYDALRAECRVEWLSREIESYPPTGTGADER